MHVVATAGHVDHGKSTLVRLLTGMEPDRWAEEHRRGMTIDLGFAWTTLMSGRQVAFVDVPGHERFVGNMLAGIGPVPAIMFVVAADEGWMPQSAEHLDALAALDTRHALLVISRSDLADPVPARDRALAEFSDASVPTAGAVCVSIHDDLDELRRGLDRLVGGLPTPDGSAPVRLWVDRAFTIRGAGTVVTGTLPAGTVVTGQVLELVPSGRRATARGLHSLGTPVETAAAVARVAVNLRGVDVAEVHRGDVLVTPDAWLRSDLIDVRLHPPAPLPAELTLHIGSAAIPVRHRPLGHDTARLRLSVALPLRVGDRALLRDPGRRVVLAGITVLDIRPPALARRGAAAARAAELSGSTSTPAAELRRRGLIRSADLEAMGLRPPVPAVAGWLVDPRHWRALRERLVELTRRYAAEHPLEPGIPIEQARHRLDLPDGQLVTALVGPPLCLRDGRIWPDEQPAGLPAGIAAAVEVVREELDRSPYQAPEANRLAELGLGVRELAAAVRAGLLLRVAETVYLLPGADTAAAEVLAGLPQPFTVSEARRALDSTRRVTVPLLELLDRQGRTARVSGRDRRAVTVG